MNKHYKQVSLHTSIYLTKKEHISDSELSRFCDYIMDQTILTNTVDRQFGGAQLLRKGLALKQISAASVDLALDLIPAEALALADADHPGGGAAVAALGRPPVQVEPAVVAQVGVVVGGVGSPAGQAGGTQLPLHRRCPPVAVEGAPHLEVVVLGDLERHAEALPVADGAQGD